jgi:hypothetical protein
MLPACIQNCDLRRKLRRSSASDQPRSPEARRHRLNQPLQHYQRSRQTQNCQSKKYLRLGWHLCQKLNHFPKHRKKSNSTELTARRSAASPRSDEIIRLICGDSEFVKQRRPKNNGVLEGQLVTAVTATDAETRQTAPAVNTGASRVSCSCRSGQVKASGLPAPAARRAGSSNRNGIERRTRRI